MNTKQTKTVDFEQIVERGCGIDVHKKEIVATIKGTNIKEQTKKFYSFTEDIELLRDWLKEHKITHVAMESTGVYWKPVYNILEEHFEVILVNARHIKHVPGHKTDKKDSKWIAKLLISGLLKGSFIPPKPIRELRDLTRYRRKIVGQIASEKNRLHKLLEDANIKLSSVISNINGVVGSKIIEALIAGEEDIDKLVMLRHNKMHCSEEELRKALNGFLTEHHRFMLKMIRASIKEKEVLVEQIQKQIDIYLEKQKIEADIELLTSVPGVGKDAAVEIVAEIGTNMEQFPNQHHLASWAGMSPGNNESAGKKKSSRITHGDKYLKIILVQCAWAATRTKNTYLRSKYERLVGRRGKKRALIGIGHKILVAAYFILKDKMQYNELGDQYLDNIRKDKQILHHLKRLKQLGYDVEQVA